MWRSVHLVKWWTPCCDPLLFLCTDWNYWREVQISGIIMNFCKKKKKTSKQMNKIVPVQCFWFSLFWDDIGLLSVLSLGGFLILWHDFEQFNKLISIYVNPLKLSFAFPSQAFFLKTVCTIEAEISYSGCHQQRKVMTQVPFPLLASKLCWLQIIIFPSISSWCGGVTQSLNQDL